MKTKRELRKEAIKRLNETEPFANGFDCYKYGIDDAIMGVFADTCTGFSIDTVRDRLISLLTDDDKLAEDDYLELLRDAVDDYREEQKSADLWHKISCDRDRYINLETMPIPRDAYGEAIHIGAEICGYGYPNGGVRCRAIVNERTILVGADCAPYRDWLMWDAGSCRHYHKPTVEDVLREFAIACEDTGNAGSEVQRLAGEYAKKLQLKEDE